MRPHVRYRSSVCPITLFSLNVICFIVFISKGIVDVLCEACEQLKWNSPTRIQKEAIPVALQGIAAYSLAFVVVLAVFVSFQFDTSVNCVYIFRQRCNRSGRNWIWKDGSICTSYITGVVRESTALLRFNSHPN